jgi:hypothetical protein
MSCRDISVTQDAIHDDATLAVVLKVQNPYRAGA